MSYPEEYQEEPPIPDIEEEIRHHNENSNGELQNNNEDINGLSQKDIQYALNILKLQNPEKAVELVPSHTSRLLRWDISKTRRLITMLCEPLCARILVDSVDNLLNQKNWNRYLSTGDRVLDDFLGGGLVSRSVTEVSGEAGSGKSQICLQMALRSQLPEEMGGLGGCSVYISTEQTSTKRMDQLASALFDEYEEHFKGIGLKSYVEICNGIMIREAKTVEQFDQALSDLPAFIAEKKVQLVVIDSIAAVYRLDFGNAKALERAKLLHKQSSVLKLCASSFNIPILVANQVSDVMNGSGFDVVGFGSSKVKPALGLSWSNSINTRIVLEKTERMITLTSSPQRSEENESNKRQKTDNLEAKVRRMTVWFSPYLPNHTCHFVITQEGLLGVE